MKDKTIKIRLSSARFNKLKLYAQKKDRTVTSILEDFIDSIEKGNQGQGSLILEPPAKPENLI